MPPRWIRKLIVKLIDRWIGRPLPPSVRPCGHPGVVTSWQERGIVVDGSGCARQYENRLYRWQCLQCEPLPSDVTNDPIFMPLVQHSGY